MIGYELSSSSSKVDTTTKTSPMDNFKHSGKMTLMSA